KNTVEIHAGFVPQILDSVQHYTNPKPDVNSYLLNRISHLHAPDQQLSSWAQWRGEWLPGLRNDLQVGYIHLSQKYKYSLRRQYSSSASSNNNAYSEDNKNYHAHQLYVRDRISYALHAGAWSFEPSVNMTYQYFKNEFKEESFSGSGPGPSNPGVSNMSTMRYTPDGYGFYVLTPVIDISYKQVLDIQWGAVMNLSHQYVLYAGTLPKRSAFASIGIDLLELDGVHRSNSLKLFGSYAQRSAYSQASYFLNDMDGNHPPSPSPTIQVPVLIGDPVGRTLPKYWVWQAG
ncbi:MAG TPA: autotransporter outer membrane beta-barrel domain-containing protein, partial [Puia sp.]|nr:autotransporter outer membrane beta-barrel domain-containing protein [Puia sp.]